ncbi:MAG: agmatine deiminase [Bacillota bacterium]|nr:agmatine deiminase [Bacillota bacterium]
MTLISGRSPADDSYRMPGEFEDHDRCWMIWPERTDNWRMGAKPAEKAFSAVAEAISRFEPVTMCVSGRQFVNARNRLPEQIRVLEMSNNDSWMRDVGPTFVINDQGGVRLVDWDFNAWGGLDGGLYFPWDQDDLIPRKIAEITGVDRYKAPLVMEGGSIHVDGEGTLITTEECLLNPNRNPGLSREQIEDYLKKYLNLKKIIWLPRGCFNDETDGHVDNLCCFSRPGEVILNWTDDKNDPQYPISLEAFEILSNVTDAQGKKLKVHQLHQPKPVIISAEECRGVDHVEGSIPRQEGDRLAASYVNFYIANGGIVMPLFGDPQDQMAVEKMEKIFPDREVTGVFAREIILGGGNIHCITQQQPSP